MEWQVDPKTGKPTVNAPITHTAGDASHIVAKVSLEVHGVPDGASVVLSGVGLALDGTGEWSLDFGTRTDIAVNGNTATVVVPSLEALGPEIRKIVGRIEWYLTVDFSETESVPVELGATGGQKGHVVYTTLATPTGADDPDGDNKGLQLVTDVRMDRTVEEVSRALTSLGSREPTPVRIVRKLVGQQIFELGNAKFKYDRAWQVPDAVDFDGDGTVDPAGGDCISIANFVMYVEAVS